MYTITIDTEFNRGIVHNHHFMAQIEALAVMSQHADQKSDHYNFCGWEGGQVQ